MNWLGKTIIETLEIEEQELGAGKDPNTVKVKCLVSRNGITFEGRYVKDKDSKFDNYHRFFELIFDQVHKPTRESELFASLFTETEMKEIINYYKSTKEFKEAEEEC